MGACGFRVRRGDWESSVQSNGNAGGCGELFRAGLGEERPDVSSDGFKGVSRSWEGHWGGNGREREEKAEKGWVCIFVLTDLPSRVMAFETIKLNSDWKKQ